MRKSPQVVDSIESGWLTKSALSDVSPREDGRLGVSGERIGGGPYPGGRGLFCVATAVLKSPAAFVTGARVC
jgi:hypothetical protein